MHPFHLHAEDLQPRLNDLGKGIAVSFNRQKWQCWIVLHDPGHKVLILRGLQLSFINLEIKDCFRNPAGHATKGADGNDSRHIINDFRDSCPGS